MRARPNIQPTVPLLCNRVKGPGGDNLEKVIKNDKVSLSNMRKQAEIMDQWYNHGRLVCWCYFCGTYRYKNSHIRCIKHG